MSSKPAASKSAPSKFALGLIFTIAMVDSIGFGIILPVMPSLLMEVSGAGLAESAVYGGWLLFAYAVMQFFFAPVLGNLSDAYGRRPVLLLSLLVLAVNYMIMGLATSLAMLLVGRLISGIGSGTMSTVNAYIADTVPA
ncbi:MAG: MFS transporter, partial [Pseudomonadales bacterium]